MKKMFNVLLSRLLICIFSIATAFICTITDVSASDAQLLVNRQEFRLNCAVGDFSITDSLTVSGIGLQEKLSITASGNIFISILKNENFSQSLQIQMQEANSSKVILYVKKMCAPDNPDDKVTLSSGNLLETVNVYGSSYPKIYINEIIASNAGSYYDVVTRSYPDWVELYNPNSFDVSLGDYYITDNPDNLTKHKIAVNGNSRISGKDFLIFVADGDKSLSALHLDFKFSADGESVLLVAPDRTTIIDSISFGKQETDISYGRKTDGDNEWVFFNGTSPNESNTLGKILGEDVSQMPIFSQSGGAYDETFLLHLFSENPEASIYYTTNGSEPSIENLGGTTYKYKQSYHPGNIFYSGESFYHTYKTLSYEASISLSDLLEKDFKISDVNAEIKLNGLKPQIVRDNAVVIRAIAVEPGKEPSKICTHTYFFDKRHFEPNHLPTISIALNEEQFIGFEQGIYVPGVDYEESILSGILSPANYRREGIEAEIPASFEIYENGIKTVDEAVGFRIHGNITRNFIPRSFRIYSRKEYGNNEISYPIFEQAPYDKYKRIILRNSGQDYNQSYFKDAMTQSLMSFTNIDHQRHRPFNVYINGEYWGILNARERIDKHYLKYKYNLDEDNVDILENALGIEVEEGDANQYNAFISQVNSINPRSEEFKAYVSKYMDVDNFIDYHILQTYAGNTDWPANNVTFWRYRVEPQETGLPYGMDGKWRWALNDIDLGFQLQQVNTNQINRLLTDRSSSTQLFRRLMQNEEIKSKLITRYSDLLNTAFKPERVIEEIDKFKSLLVDDIEDHIARWDKPGSMDVWETSIERLNNYASQRQEVSFLNMKSSFSLKDLDSITVDVNSSDKGVVKVNTIKIDTLMPGVNRNAVYPWGGRYFKDRSILLVAMPQFGYKFSHWELDNEFYHDNDTLEFNFNKHVYVKAYFEEDKSLKDSIFLTDISICPYEFTEWNYFGSSEIFPNNMSFYYMEEDDPELHSDISGMLKGIKFDHDSKTRISALGSQGLSLINTATENENYYARRLGIVAISISTQNLQHVNLKFKAGTVIANARKYNIRLQYRVGTQGSITDLYDNGNQLVEYQGSDVSGNEKSFDIKLPAEIMNKDTVQLIWRYYYRGEQVHENTNQRDELRLDDIFIVNEDAKQSIDTLFNNSNYEKKLIGHIEGNSYQWYQCDGAAASVMEGEIDKELLIKESGYYAVQTDIGDCKLMSDCHYFKVGVVTSLDTDKGISVGIYPNPSNGTFYLNFEHPVKNAKVILMDAFGKTIDITETANRNSIYYDKGLSAGIYFLQIIIDNQQAITKKLMVQ